MAFEPWVIYGDDNRHEVYAEPSRARRQAALSTVALVPKKLVRKSGSHYRLVSESYRESYNLCAGEPFANQRVVSECSAFLVAPDTVVTAGHCIYDEASCKNYKFVFDYAYLPNEPRTVPASSVYSCRSVVHTEVNPGSDFAVVRLNRPVTDRAPVQVRMSGAVAVGDPLYVVGYPAGLPAKISGGARVRSVDERGFILANLDTYGGNSGSAVFNDANDQVEGILVEGEADFVMKGNCMVSNRCADDACIGESLTPMSVVLPYLRR